MKNLKKALSMVLASAMLFGMMVVGTGAAHTDVTAEHNKEAIEVVSTVGIMGANEEFNPDAKITRNEMAVVMVNMLGLDAKEFAGASTFTDGDNKHWAAREIAIVQDLGWIEGYPNNTFKPDDTLTRAEMVTMINRVLQRVPEHKTDLLPDMVQWPDNMDPFKWYYLAIQEATNSHDYSRKENGYEYWTVLKEVRDWSELER
jgi:homoserine acetyltransferase